MEREKKTSCSGGGGRKRDLPPPGGYETWLVKLNQTFGTRYTARSVSGRQNAKAFAARLREGWTLADLVRAVDCAAEKAKGGWPPAAYPNVILARVDEMLSEQTIRKAFGGNGKAHVFRTGQAHLDHLAAMRKVVEWG